MGWFDVFACCVGRRQHKNDTSETDVLVAPNRARGASFKSQEGYGTTGMTTTLAENGRRASGRSLRPSDSSPPGKGLTDAQRERMHEISRTAGSHMRPIGNYVAGRSVSPLPRSSSGSGLPSTGGLRLTSLPSAESSRQSSRTSSPSPPRPESSPPDDIISPAHSQRSRRSSHAASSRASSANSHISDGGKRVVSAPVTKAEEEQVVHKSIFDGMALVPSAQPQSSSRRSSASSRKKKRRVSSARQ